jgi:hypothetical protein
MSAVVAERLRSRKANVNQLTGIAAFMATREGLTLAKSFMRISNRQMRQQIVSLVEELGAVKP